MAARLDATGTGLDKAVFGTIDTVKGMYARAYEKGQRFLDEADPDNFISTILIKNEEGRDPGEVVKAIRKALGGVKVVESQSMIRNTADNMKRIGVLLYIFGFLFVLTLTVTVYLVFYITLNERKKEIGTENELYPLAIEYSFLNILGNPQYEEKTKKMKFVENSKYQSHLIKVLPLIYTDNYTHDDVLLSSFDSSTSS